MIGYDRTHGFYAYDPTTNYCGPNYSDGKVQPSVKHGKSEPLNTRDANCQAHDTCYAIANSDSNSFDSCDNSFYERSKKDSNLLGRAYGIAVLYGNRFVRKKNSSLRQSKNTMAQAQDSLYMPGGFKHPTVSLRRSGEDIGAQIAALDVAQDSSTISDINAGGQSVYLQDRPVRKPKEASRKEAEEFMWGASKKDDTCKPPSTGKGGSQIAKPPNPGKGSSNPPKAGKGYSAKPRAAHYGAVPKYSKYNPNRKRKKKKGFLESLYNIKDKLNRVHLA